MTAARLVPPRPNPGPEPFAEPGPAWGWVVGLTIVTGLWLGLWAWRRNGKGKGKGRGRPSEEGRREAVGTEAEIVALAETARAALVARFGTTWRAKTTEEIAVDPSPVEAFGLETAGRLVALLGEADRVKFSGEATGAQGGEAVDWVAWVASFVAAAGARSTINAK